MFSQELSVREVRGRYPAAQSVLRSCFIIPSVNGGEAGNVQTIRLDDSANPEMWLEIDVVIKPQEGPCAQKSAAGST